MIQILDNQKRERFSTKDFGYLTITNMTAYFITIIIKINK